MSLVVFDNVSVSYGDRAVIDGASMRISEVDRIGLIGPNGSGKTTLLRIVAGEQPFEGTVQRSRRLRVGYLPQEIAVDGGKGLLDFVISSVPGRAELDGELAEAEAALARGSEQKVPDDELIELGHRVADLHERLDHFDMHYSEHEASRILAGLGFETTDAERDLAEFSGGWRMRALLASLLFQQPDLLLLDEPTNHLDMPSVAWFSGFLSRYKRAFILISHDREFLNEQIRRVISFEPEGLRFYTGDYETYVRNRAEEQAVLEAKARNLAREREHAEKFIERFRYKASKAKAVQSRIKALEKMDTVQTYVQRRVMAFSFPPCDRLPAEVARLENVHKAYGDHVVLDAVNVGVRRGERVGIIGPNGAGKTTLLKMIGGELAPDKGRISLGNKVQLGYYAQHHADTLRADATAYEAVQEVRPDTTPNRIRTVLGAFLFSGDDVDKKVSVLSGGERARVALARLMIDPGNVILMDEPTNHLDLASSESLAESLSRFEGALVFVSHNRSLIRSLATVIWDVHDRGVVTYPGTLDEYMDHHRRLRDEAGGGASAGPAAQSGAAAMAAAATATADDADAAGTRGTREAEKERKRIEAKLRNQRSKVINPIQERIAGLEARIAELEQQQGARSSELSDPTVYDDATRRNKLLNTYQSAARKLEELTARWEHAVEELERAEAELERLQGDASS